LFSYQCQSKASCPCLTNPYHLSMGKLKSLMFREPLFCIRI
jgi:hypothetical protein